MAARNGASGFSTLLICERREGRLLIQCRESDEMTMSKVLGEKVVVREDSSSERVVRVICMFVSLLKGSVLSRWRRVGELSAEIRWSILVEREGEVGFEGSGSGFGATRARAILQLLAPKSRTVGKCRFISWAGVSIGEA